jgi:hypothetical protein
VSDRFTEAQKKVIERIRKSGGSKDYAQRKAAHAVEIVKRGVDRGTIQYPRD